MFKSRLLFILLCISLGAAAQQKNRTDTLPKVDSSSLDDIKESVLDNIPVVSLDEDDMGTGGANLTSSVNNRDPFFSAASFNFSPVRFRIRGYDNELFSTYMNGIPMDNLDNGFAPYGLWGGLNDVMRNRDVTYGLRNTSFAYGDIGGTTSIDTRAFRQRPQTSVGYAISNRNYNNRISFTHSSGLRKNGWAYTLSGSRRWADEGYVPGTYYDGWSYFVGVDKKFNEKHMLSLVTFGAPTENGRQGGAVQEIMDLAGTNYYNPNWGYQSGKKRNASIGYSYQPFVILTHDFKITSKSSLITAAGYSSGDRTVTALDWYNAADPRPDYYRYLPSYYNDNPVIKQQIYNQLANNEASRQVNWQGLYDANRGSLETVQNANGIQGNSVTGLRSHYIQEERVTNTKRLNINSVFNTKVSSVTTLTFGASYQSQKNNYYKTIADLLGGDFYVDLNQFAERDFPSNPNAGQNDLNNPNRILHVGDRYGYDYNIDINRTALWGQASWNFKSIDFFLASELSKTKFWRVGNVRSGLFPNNSYGKSTVNDFNNYSVKAGVAYNINFRNSLYLNAGILTKAPYFENAYISPRTRDLQQKNLVNEKVQTVEAGYILSTPSVKFRLNGYYTNFEDGLNVMTFYHDEYRNFVNYALSNIDKVHFGGELGFETRLTPRLTLNGAAAAGRYYYNSRQDAVITLDNNATVLNTDLIYSQNYRVPSTPQEAYSLGLTYRSRDYWFVSLTGNYFDQMWLDFNPIRRTSGAVDGLAYKGDLYNSILGQTQFSPQHTIDFFGGWSWKLPRKYSISGKTTFLAFNAGVNNLLDNTNIISGGYEQLRFDPGTKDINRFPPKLYYAYGRNFLVSATLRF